MTGFFHILHVRPGYAVALGLSCLLLLGCEESVDPILEADEAFSFYGFFDADADTQATRIFTLEPNLRPTPPAPLDVIVQSTDLNTDETIVWQDSIVQYLDGTIGHVFWAPFQAQYGHTYRLQAQRPDGSTTSVEAKIPALSQPELQEPELSPNNVHIPVFWPDTPRLLATEVAYRLNLVLSDTTSVLRNIVIPYTDAPIETANGWTVSLDLSRDAQIIFEDRDLPLGSRLFLIDIEMRTFVSNRAWFPPGGIYDPNLLVQPGTFTNVENGFGFVGAGYRSSISWLPDTEVLDRVGLQVE